MDDLAYVKYSAKELLTDLHRKVDKLSEDMNRISLHNAALPAVYVTHEQVEINRREAMIAKRWAITSAISTAGVLVAALFLLVP